MFNFIEKPIISYTIQDLAWCFILYGSVFALISYIMSGLFHPIDPTDKDAWHRSGVSIVVDHGTGMQYLKTPEGYLTPRLGVK